MTMSQSLNHTLLFFCTASLLLLASCRADEKKTDRETPAAEIAPGDSCTEYRTEKAGKADIVFDDFLLAYISDSALQWKRTRFPLPHIGKNGEKTYVAEKDWKMTTLFGGEELYTVISNAEADLDLPTRTDLAEGSFEWIYPDKDLISAYHFRRNGQGAWYLDSLRETSLKDNPNGDFLEFYKKFATDIDFQKQHVRNPIDFVTNFTDDDAGFSTEHFKLNVEQWLAWQVPMPAGKFTNVVYGKPDAAQVAASTLKIMSIKAMDGAFFKTLYFRKGSNGEWYLYRYEDTAY